MMGAHKARRDNPYQPFSFDDLPYLQPSLRDRRALSLVGVHALEVIQEIQSAMNPSLRMKMLFLVPLVLLVAVVASTAYVADQMFGVVAFTYRYLAFCLLVGLAFGGVWHAYFRKSALAFALVVSGILAANFFLPPPSERLLRSAMLKLTPGTNASAIVDIVKQQYEDSPYAMPWIHEDQAGGFDRVHVSLLSQKARNCTSVIFLVENGRVSRSIFSPD